jgi:HAE1 family hydrophobic/amphiphilic exporter-1
VILEVGTGVSADPSKLSQIYVRASGGKLMPLDTVTHVSRRRRR